MLRLNLTNAALSFPDDLPGKQFKQVVITLFNLLKNPTPQDSSLLKGYPYRRVDIGEYRIVYQVQGEDLLVLVIGKRNDDDVYKITLGHKYSNAYGGEKMSDVFISYSNKDRNFVERLVRDLDAAGVNAFYDERIKPGDSWAESLARAVESANYLLVVLSPDSVISQWVDQETRIGLAREADGQAHVIPLLVRPCEIPVTLAGKTYASFDRDYAEGLQRVLAVLKGEIPPPIQKARRSLDEIARLKSGVDQFRTGPTVLPAQEKQSSEVRDRMKCFIVMPFGDEDLQVVYEDFVKPVLANACMLDVERGDDVFGSNVVMEDIRSSILTADLVVADLTRKNANVFYEVGICHALEKPVLLLAQSMDDVPFDLRHLRVLLYNYSPRGCKRLEGTLKENIDVMLSKLRSTPHG